MPARRSIIFMGSPDFAVPSLEACAREHDVKAVFSQPPRKRGRGMAVRPSPVHQRADELGLKVCTPLRFDDNALAELRDIRPEFLVVVAYGIILPVPALEAASVAAINGHASLLPRWRGAAPIHRAIASGDVETGVTTMLMEKELDAGPMLLKRATPVLPDDTTGRLHDRLAGMTADALAETLDRFDDILPEAQDLSKVTWAEKISPAEAEIDFSQPGDVIERRIRAFAPFPGAWLSYADGAERRRLKVLSGKITAGRDGRDKISPGEVLGKGGEGGPLIATSDGAIELVLVQPQGRPVMDGRAFLNGNALPQVILPSETG